ncbi:MAG TPA: long-chain fatty acid--CoA ligase [Nocardioidaceae bacterium]|nr:long-chain fatty acid--CoA ligase [Nocardioidaceae bacterium]
MSVAHADDHTVVENRAANVGKMFFDRVEQTPDREAYRYPSGDSWQSVTWAQTGDRVRRIAAGLVALGIEPEQRVAIASSTRFEWVLADLAIMCAGAATSTVYPTTIGPDVGFILADSDSRMVFAEDDEQIAKIRERATELPALRKIITFTGATDGDQVLSLADLEALGERQLAETPSVVDDRVAATTGSSLATLIYTSGTTGRPKGVCLQHSSWTYEGAAIAATGILEIDDLQYLWLPMAHSFGKVLLTSQLAIGFASAVDGRVDKIIDNLAVVQPTFMGAAPRIFEKAHGRIVTMAEQEGGAKAKIFTWAFRVGRDVARRRLAGETVPPLLALQHKVADRLVFAKIRARFGGRVRFFISGAAALSKDVAEWFYAAGILILEGYGLTETSAGSSVNRPTSFKLGTVGFPLPGTQFTVAEDGEILVKGPGVMQGYHGPDDQARGSVAVDGWLHTGDIGEIDSDGFVRITDRKKDLFKTSGGKYVAPSTIEGQFKAVCPYASQIVVHGADRSFCTALITLDPDAIRQWADHHGQGEKTYQQLVTSPEVQAMVDGYVKELNAQLNRWETIKRFVVLERDLSVEAGEMTPSLKVRRKVVEDSYRDQLNSLYS